MRVSEAMVAHVRHWCSSQHLGEEPVAQDADHGMLRQPAVDGALHCCNEDECCSLVHLPQALLQQLKGML